MKTLKLHLLLTLAVLLSSTHLFSQARLQVIHNSADAAAKTVDVWLNNDLLIDNFEFRTATPFIDAPAGEEFFIHIKDQNSDARTEPIASFDFILEDGATYVVVANGIVSPTGYEPNQPFNLYVYDMARESSMVNQNTDILVFHGSTDAPMVDVHEVAVPAGEVVDDLNYGTFAGYLELPENNYSLQIRDMYGSNVVAQFAAPLADLGTSGLSLTVVASGFLNPAVNNNGPAFGLWVATPAGGDLIPLPAETISTARVQIIHNSADELAKVVDIYLNDNLFIDNFEFRTATPFVDAPAGTELNIDILPFNSTSSDNPVATFDLVLEGGGVYQVVANGLIDAQSYSPFVPFNLYVYDMAREYAMNVENTDVMVFHGSTDAPTVDVFEVRVGAGQIVDDLAYADFAGYLELPQLNYSLQVRSESGTDVVAQYGAPIQALGLAGSSLTVVASGFLNPAANNDGPSFGLWVALPTGGELIPLPQEDISTARVQVIHNSADPAAAVVDVWLNGQLLIDNFGFRTATPFIDAPAGQELQVAILPPNSESASNPIADFNFVLESNQKYVLIANGDVGSEAVITGFNIYPYAPAREMSMNEGMVDINIFHGSTDAPSVDLFEVSDAPAQIWNDLTYADFTGYLELPVDDYSLQVRDASGTIVVAQYGMPLQTLGVAGQALTVVASGYLAPTTDNLPTFGLWAAPATGGNLIPLPKENVSTARVQIIHNSADMAAEMVDVWLNGEMLVDDFMFRTATPYIDAPAGVELEIAIQPANSTSAENPIASFNLMLEGGQKYTVIANGIVSPSGYDPAEPFNLWVYAGSREMSADMETTDVKVFHGATDAPVVDVYEVGVGAGQIIDDLGYSEFAGYLSLPTDNYSLQIRDASGTVTVATYYAPLSGLNLGGEALTIVASGFLNPGINSEGPDFGLWVALPAGGPLVELPSLITSVDEEVIVDADFAVYPNPAINNINMQYTVTRDENVTIEVFDLVGNKVYFEQTAAMADGVNVNRINVSALPSGLYILRLSAGESQVTNKFKVYR